MIKINNLQDAEEFLDEVRNLRGVVFQDSYGGVAIEYFLEKFQVAPVKGCDPYWVLDEPARWVYACRDLINAGYKPASEY